MCRVQGKSRAGVGPCAELLFAGGATTTESLRHSTIDESWTTNALDCNHHPPTHSRISALSTLSQLRQQPAHHHPFDLSSWSFTSNHLPIQWHPLPLLRRRRAAISKMRNHAMPARNGTSAYPSACLPKARLLAVRSPSPSPSHPVRRTTRDANICANQLDF